MPAEMEGATAPTPESPTSPKIAPDTLEQYFESIEEPFHETENGLARKNPIRPFVIGFVFCLIPLIPFLLSQLVFWLVGPRVISVRTIHLRVSSFWLWWVASFALSLLVLIVASKMLAITAEEKKSWLSPAQMRFAYCYSIVHEIRRYRTNQLNRHIDAAVMYLDKTATTLFRAAHVEMAESLYADEYWRTESVRAARTSLGSMFVGNVPKWFRLRPETETILQGCQEIIPKLRDRLKDRKDLGAVEAALFDLTAYQYTEIPELSDTQSETRFEAGTESLIRFAQSVIALPPYRSEPMAATPEEKMSRRLLLATQKLSLPFTDSNVLIAFCAWLILMSILFWGGFYIASRFVAIKMDSTIMATLIGGPIATAVTGATIPRLGKTKKQEK